MAVIRPEHGVNLNPKGPSGGAEKVITVVVIVAFLAGMFALLGWMIGFDKVSGAVFAALLLVVIAAVISGIGWIVSRLVRLVRK